MYRSKKPLPLDLRASARAFGGPPSHLGEQVGALGSPSGGHLACQQLQVQFPVLHDNSGWKRCSTDSIGSVDSQDAPPLHPHALLCIFTSGLQESNRL